MYVNMNSKKSAVPLNDDGKMVLGISRKRGNRRAKKILSVACVALFVVLNVALFGATIIVFSRLNSLEYEVELLRNSVKLQGEIINSIVDLEDNILYEQPYEEQRDTSTETVVASLDEYDDDSFEYDYDYLNETTIDIDKLVEELKLSSNLTKEGKETSRAKRSVVAATEDGVVINSETYAERKAKNNTRRDRYRMRGHTITALPARPSSFGSSPYTPGGYSSEESTQYTKSARKTAPPVYVRQSRVMHRNNKLKARNNVRKAALRSADPFSEEVTASPDMVIVRDFGRRSRMGRVRLPTIHYNGDTSKYVLGQHTNFNGNGHLRHPKETFVDWKVSDWATAAGMDNYFDMDDGVLTVKESGIYFVYAQIYYLDEHDTTGFKVFKNRNNILLQCTITVHTRERSQIGNTCYTAGAEYLSEGDTISLSDVTGGRYSIFEPGKSFFGLIKLSDLKIK